MTEQLFIQIPETSSQTYNWLLRQADGTVTSHGSTKQLKSLKAQARGKKIVAIVPGTLFLLSETKLAHRYNPIVQKKIEQAMPEWQQRLLRADLKAQSLVLDYECLPEFTDSWLVFVNKDYTIIQFAKDRILCIPTSELDDKIINMLQNGEINQPVNIDVYNFTDEKISLTIADIMPEIVQYHNKNSWLAFLSDHFRYSLHNWLPQQTVTRKRSPAWFALAAAVIVTIGVTVGAEIAKITTKPHSIYAKQANTLLTVS